MPNPRFIGKSDQEIIEILESRLAAAHEKKSRMRADYKNFLEIYNKSCDAAGMKGEDLYHALPEIIEKLKTDCVLHINNLIGLLNSVSILPDSYASKTIDSARIFRESL